MASLVFIRDIEDKNPDVVWERTGYKSIAKWKAGAGAKEEPINLRPGLTTFCHRLPDGRRVKAEVMDEETMAEHREFERALNSVGEYVADTTNPLRWRAKALGDAMNAEAIKRKKRC